MVIIKLAFSPGFALMNPILTRGISDRFAVRTETDVNSIVNELL